MSSCDALYISKWCHVVTTCDTMMQLSPELVHYIGTFCVPSSLAALACANSLLQRHAETVLYQKVSDGFWSNRCIQSLCSNATRASFVRSLAIVLPDLRSHEVLDSLASALTQMPSLLDLRVKAPGGHHAAAKKVLDHILTYVKTRFSSSYTELSTLPVAEEAVSSFRRCTVTMPSTSML